MNTRSDKKCRSLISTCLCSLLVAVCVALVAVAIWDHFKPIPTIPLLSDGASKDLINMRIGKDCALGMPEIAKWDDAWTCRHHRIDGLFQFAFLPSIDSYLLSTFDQPRMRLTQLSMILSASAPLLLAVMLLVPAVFVRRLRPAAKIFGILVAVLIFLEYYWNLIESAKDPEHPIGLEFRQLVFQFLAVAVPTAIVLLLDWRDRGRPSKCDACDYDLTGNVSGRCPECETSVTPKYLLGRVGRAKCELTQRGGSVTIGQQSWDARPLDSLAAIESGTRVIVRAFRGRQLIVAPHRTGRKTR